MIVVHRSGLPRGPEQQVLRRQQLQLNEEIPSDALWIDLIDPSREEDAAIEKHLSIAIPTREEMRDIEPSEILYPENNALYMTSRILCHSDTEAAKLANITFILSDRALVTVRYDDPRSFQIVKPGGCGLQPEAVLDGLIEAIIDRAAEILARVGDEVEITSRGVFESGRNDGTSNDYQGTIYKLGRIGDLISNVRESMVSLERMLLFLSANMSRPTRKTGFQAEWRTAVRDVQSIEDHASFLSSKIQFVLDATLGLVSLQQNNIVKLFSVLAVIFMPPTLVASIYGMNFKVMPELSWEYGYPMAIFLMVAAAVAPYVFFRWKKWL
jgi:magnesium transporter